MNLVPITIGEQFAYRVNETVYCTVQLARPEGAASSMYGCLATATAITADGEPLQGDNGAQLRGRHTESVMKLDLMGDPEGVAAAVMERATRGAVMAMLTEMAVQAANNVAGI